MKYKLLIPIMHLLPVLALQLGTRIINVGEVS